MMMLSKRLVHPDVYSIAVSSDATMTALWSSNLVARRVKQVALLLTFKNGALERLTSKFD